jgi:hypothetical protein
MTLRYITAARPVAGYNSNYKGANNCGSSVTVYETGPSNVCPLKLQMLLGVMSSDARLRRHQREAGSVERVTELAKRWEYGAFVPNNWHAFRQRKSFLEMVPAAKHHYVRYTKDIQVR